MQACCSNGRGDESHLPPITTTIHSHVFVMALLQWHKIYNFSEDELHRLPLVALSQFTAYHSEIMKLLHVIRNATSHTSCQWLCCVPAKLC